VLNPLFIYQINREISLAQIVTHKTIDVRQDEQLQARRYKRRLVHSRLKLGIQAMRAERDQQIRRPPIDDRDAKYF
jgi:hypothetical protein